VTNADCDTTHSGMPFVECLLDISYMVYMHYSPLVNAVNNCVVTT